MSIINELKEAIGPNKVLTGDQLKSRYPHVWEMDVEISAKALTIPVSTEDVAAICKICNHHKQSIIIHGGLTNLVGSTYTDKDDIVVSLEKMNKILEVDPVSRTITVEAGVILESIQQTAYENDLLFPLNFGAKGTAQIGGSIASNAGGMRVVKFGMTRNQILGLEAVLPDGTIISSLKKLMKDNTGYDLKHLLIGSEGTLGIVTKAVVRLREKPKSRNAAFVAFNDYERVTSFLKYIDVGLGGKLSCFELLWQSAYKTLTSPPSVQKAPLPYDYKYYVLIESLGANQHNDLEELKMLLEKAVESEMIIDAAIAHTYDELNWFFNIREDVGVMIANAPAQQQYDISLPISDIGPYVNERLEILNEQEGVQQAHAFGHLGDGNIHFVILKESSSPDLTKRLNEIVYAPLQALNGSVSAEHGIGRDKKSYLHLSRSPEEVMLMKKIKAVCDPNNILNPGRIFI